MSAVTSAWLELGTFAVVLTLLTPFLGGYLARVFGEGPYPVGRVLGELEARVYRLCRIDPTSEMPWTTYLATVAVFTSSRWPRSWRCCARSSGYRSTRSISRTCRRCWRSTSPPASRRPPTGRPTPGRAPSATSRRWRGWPGRTSSPPRSAWRWRSRRSAASHARTRKRWAIFGST